MYTDVLNYCLSAVLSGLHYMETLMTSSADEYGFSQSLTNVTS